MSGEDPLTGSLEEARRWVAVYRHLVRLEQELLESLARVIPNMPGAAQREAEETNLPVLTTQLERFTYRLELWRARVHELESHSA